MASVSRDARNWRCKSGRSIRPSWNLIIRVGGRGANIENEERSIKNFFLCLVKIFGDTKSFLPIRRMTTKQHVFSPSVIAYMDSQLHSFLLFSCLGEVTGRWKTSGKLNKGWRVSSPPASFHVLQKILLKKPGA
ncbi:hypothetical protein AKJ16_DCAP25361 [Drosera capensis]